MADVEADANSGVPLLTLPDELMAMCLPGDGPGGCITSLATMRTCRRFLHMYLNGPERECLRLRVALAERPHLSTRSTALPLLAQSFPSLHKLEVAIGKGSREEQLRQLLLMPAPPVPASQWTSQLTHLRVVGGVMIELIPAFLSDACPHMKDLEYREVTFQFQSPEQWQPSILQKLQQLHLHQCQQLPASDQFRRQLSALPSLTHFSYTPHADGVHPDAPSTACTAVAEAVSTRVTHLCVFAVSNSSCSTEPIIQLLATHYTALESLHVPGIAVSDSILTGILQSAPQLRRVQVAAFHLLEEYGSKPSTWKQVFMNHVDVVSLARLPLSSVTHLSILRGDGSSTLQPVHTGISADTDMDLTAKAVAAVQRCGGLRCQGGLEQNTTVIISLLACSERLLSASIPLLTHLHAIRLHHAQLTLPLLQALGGMPALRMLGFGFGCWIPSTVWEEIPKSLPQVDQLQFVDFLVGPWTLALIVWRTTHPITLRLQDKEWDQEDRNHMQLVITQLGRELCTVRYDTSID